MTRDERSLGSVPAWLYALLAATLALQLAFQATHRPAVPQAEDLPAPPPAWLLRMASLDEPEAVSRAAMLYLQTFDLGGGNALPYRRLDYRRLASWLGAIADLDPRSEYPFFAASRVYADIPDAARVRIMLEFVYEQFLRDPNHRWPWLAHAAFLAKHRLHDLALARRYAAAVDQLTTAPDVPLWAKQMEIFILEDLNELEAAKVMLGGLLESGTIKDPNEARFLEQRLADLEARLAAQKRQK